MAFNLEPNAKTTTERIGNTQLSENDPKDVTKAIKMNWVRPKIIATWL